MSTPIEQLAVVATVLSATQAAARAGLLLGGLLGTGVLLGLASHASSHQLRRLLAALGWLALLGTTAEAANLWLFSADRSSALEAVAGLAIFAAAVLLLAKRRLLSELVASEQKSELQRQLTDARNALASVRQELESTSAACEQQVQANEAMRAELGRRVDELNKLFDILPVGVAIAEDAHCRSIRGNLALSELLRIPANANASLTAASGEAPTHFRVLDPSGAELAPAQLPMQVCARENRPVAGSEVVVEFADRTRRDLVVNALPLQDAAGNSTGCVAVFHDTTALRALARQNELYAAILSNAEDAIIAKDLRGNIIEWNRGAERLFGYTAAEMLGRSVLVLIPEDRVGEEHEIMQTIGAGQVVPQFDTMRCHKSGHLIDVSVQISPVRDRSGQVIGASKTARDNTTRRLNEQTRRELEAKLQETQKLESLGVLAGGIAHDFNNLLTSILGGASLLRSEYPTQTEAKPVLDMIETASRRAADLCRQLLAYAGRGKFTVRAVDVNELINETTHLLNISIGKNCVVRTRFTAKLPAILADATQIRQVVMNLVINASEAIGARSGVITLSTGLVRADSQYLSSLRTEIPVPTGDYVFIEVSDNGCGIDPGAVAKIFDPFYTTKFTGRGLGLAAVLGIVRSHKGGIKVYSEPGAGTTFKILLPAIDLQADDWKNTYPDEDDWRGDGTALVVDDEETVRAISARILEGCGFRVEVANDGLEALNIFRRQPTAYRLVLMDLTMPHLDGEETFRQLRSINPEITVVLMSGFNEQEAISRFTGKGLAGFVQKPFEVRALIQAVRRAVEKA